MKISSYTKIGFIMVIAISLLLWGLQFLQGKNFFKNENYFFVTYKKVEGLQVSSFVVINGFKIGKVRDIYLNPPKNRELVVRFTVKEGFNIPKNTVAKIYSSDLMGTKAIKLIVSASNENHNFGDTIIGKIETDLKEEVNRQMLPFKRKAEDLMGSMDSVLIVIRSVFNEKTRVNLKESFFGIKKIIGNLEKTTLYLDTIIQNQQSKIRNTIENVESISANLKANNENLSKIINNMVSFSDTLSHLKLNEIVKNTNKLIEKTNETINKINNGDGTFAMMLNDKKLYENLEKSSINLAKLLEDIKLNPKKYIHYSLFDMGKVIYLEEDSKEFKKILEKKNKK